MIPLWAKIAQYSLLGGTLVGPWGPKWFQNGTEMEPKFIFKSVFVAFQSSLFMVSVRVLKRATFTKHCRNWGQNNFLIVSALWKFWISDTQCMPNSILNRSENWMQKGIPEIVQKRPKIAPTMIQNRSEMDQQWMSRWWWDLRWHFGGILAILEGILALQKWGEDFQLANYRASRPSGEE